MRGGMDCPDRTANGDEGSENAISRPASEFSPSPAALRFAVDRMLLKLGSHLRILGYDTLWDPALRIHELILVADKEQRIVLTCNKHVGSQFPVPKQWLLVPSARPAEQLRHVICALKLDPCSGLFTRCVKCNAPTSRLPDKLLTRGRVPERVWQQFESFTRCPACGSIYWRGSHVRNTCLALGLPFPPDNSQRREGSTNPAEQAIQRRREAKP